MRRLIRWTTLGVLLGLAALPAAAQQSVHVVQPGETLFAISRLYGMSVGELRALNDLASDRIRVGQRLVVRSGDPQAAIPPAPAEPASAEPVSPALAEPEPAEPEPEPLPLSAPVGPPPEEEIASLPEVEVAPPPPRQPETMTRLVIGAGGTMPVRPAAGASAEVHVVQPGETLFAIAQQYGLTIEALREMNRLRGDFIESGQRLVVSEGATPAVAVPRSSKPYRVTESVVPDDMVHVVRRGDTLYGIARRYGTTVSRLLALNTVTTGPIPPGTLIALPDSVGVRYYREPAPPPEPDEAGLALVYPASYQGRETISGEPYDPAQLTASHRTLEFGTVLEVTAPKTGRSVLVRINDRGPVAEGFITELSDAAAEALGLPRGAAERVELRVVR